MSWFKLHNDIIHDPKIRALAYEDRWHFVALMCLMNDGTLDEPEAIREELVEVCLGLHGVDLASLKKRLVRLRLIDQNWTPVNWDKRQESKDKTAAARMRKYRESLKKSKSDGDVTRNVTDELRTEVRSKKEEVRNPPVLRTDDGFDEFWNLYGKKLKKPDAQRAWKRLSEKDRKLAMADVSIRVKQDPQWTKAKKQFQPYAATYLNAQGWTDEWEQESADSDVWSLVE